MSTPEKNEELRDAIRALESLAERGGFAYATYFDTDEIIEITAEDAQCILDYINVLREDIFL